jgi:phospholipid/cholesterol/gamma-HCH transport system permease protein
MITDFLAGIGRGVREFIVNLGYGTRAFFAVLGASVGLLRPG